MKGDVVESWMWKSPELIIERLLTKSSRRRSPSASKPRQKSKPRDRYYTQARRLEVQAAAKRAMQGAR